MAGASPLVRHVPWCTPGSPWSAWFALPSGQTGSTRSGWSI